MILIAFVTTFAIFQILANNPITKELARRTLFYLSGKLVIAPKKLK